MYRFFLALSFPVCLAIAQTGDAPIRITFPATGTVVTADQDVSIAAQLAPAFRDPASTRFIRFAALKTDGSASFVVSSGDPRSFRGEFLADAVWDISQVPSGDYYLVAMMQETAGINYQSMIAVTVNRPPVLTIDILLQQPAPGGVQITFLPSASDPEGDSIHSIVWDPGDGSAPVTRPGLEPFTHLYRGQPEHALAFVLSAKAEDARGARGEAQRDVVVADSTAHLEQSNDCGCADMQIFSRAGQSSAVYCGVGGVPPSQGCTAEGRRGTLGCSMNSTPYSCPIGPLLPGANFAWRFEVFARLSPGTNAQPNPETRRLEACTEGQVVQASRTRNGQAVAARTANRVPAAIVGPPGNVRTANQTVPGINNNNPPDYGADDYTNPNTFKQHSLPTTVKWIDAPGLTRNANGAPANSLGDHAIFVTWLTGKLGTCWCRFEIDHSWTAAAGRTGPPVVKILGGQSCSQPDELRLPGR